MQQSACVSFRWGSVIEGIRARTDVIVYPTIPLAGSGYAAANAERRFAHTVELAKRGLPEWTVCDPGSCNFMRFEEVSDAAAGFVYQNPMTDIREGLRLSREHKLHPGYAIYEPGFTRLGAALARAMPELRTPIYRFMFSDEFAWGFPRKQSIWRRICGCWPTFPLKRHGWSRALALIYDH